MALTRRVFLGRVAAGASGAMAAGLLSPLLAGATVQPRIALVGCGARGATLAQWLNARDNAALVAVYDTESARAEILATTSGARAVSAWQALIDDQSIAGLIVATPDDTHLPIALAAAAAGKSIYLETPAVGPQDDLRALLAGDPRQQIQVGADDAQLWALVQHAAFRACGPVRHAQFHDRVNTRTANLHAPAWQRDPARTFGVAAARVYHKALAYHRLLGIGLGLRDASLQHDGEPGRVPEHVVLSLRYENGSSAIFCASPHAMAPQADVIRFAAGCAELFGGGQCRVSDDDGRVQDLGGAAGHGAASAPALLAWCGAIRHGDAAVLPLHHALPIHEAFVKALA